MCRQKACNDPANRETSAEGEQMVAKIKASGELVISAETDTEREYMSDLCLPNFPKIHFYTAHESCTIKLKTEPDNTSKLERYSIAADVAQEFIGAVMNIPKGLCQSSGDPKWRVEDFKEWCKDRALNKI